MSTEGINDLFYLIFPLLTIIAVAALHWLKMRMNECPHDWSNWSDPITDEGHPYQLRACKKCNAYQSRLIGGDKA